MTTSATAGTGFGSSVVSGASDHQKTSFFRIPVSVPSRRGSSPRHGDRAEEIPFAQLDAASAQDGVGDREVEIEVRQHEVVEVVATLHVPLVVGAERKRDVAIGGGID